MITESEPIAIPRHNRTASCDRRTTAPFGLAVGSAGSAHSGSYLHQPATSLNDYELKGVIGKSRAFIGSSCSRVSSGFILLLLVGYGSSAVVYSALFLPQQRRFAIKMIDLDIFERKQIDELRRETALMALSHHENVLPVYTSFVSSSKLCIVTPYLSGGSCVDIMKTAFPDGLDETCIATILKQALEGLAYLHKNGHIHRDIKAGNLLMDEDGTIVLSDFGVSSSLIETGERNARRTFVGTPCWMAPEVMEQAAQDYKVDIWSFGITAIELATGQAPFAKLPPLKVLLMTLSNDPPTLPRETSTHSYSRLFKEMVDACLNKDPCKRPSAEKLLLHPFFKQARKKDHLVKTILVGLPPLELRPRKKIQRHEISLSTPTEDVWDFGDHDPKKDTASSPPKRHITFGEVVVR
ncbi:kinase-like protein, partial [Hesseltinella vesiculosa]